MRTRPRNAPGEAELFGCTRSASAPGAPVPQPTNKKASPGEGLALAKRSGENSARGGGRGGRGRRFRGAVLAHLDGDRGLGHVPATFAMRTAVAKARQTGIGVVSVRNSAHFGACGPYGLMAAEAGFIGMVSTTASSLLVAPDNQTRLQA